MKRLLFLLAGSLLAGNVSMSAQNVASQDSVAGSSAKVALVMKHALERCRSEINGVTRISWQPASQEDFEEIKAMGEAAVDPLSAYLDLKVRDGFTQLFAVKFLIAIGTSSTAAPLKRAFAEDQWEVTRAQALSGLFELSESEAAPYVKSALSDDSALVRQRARDLVQIASRSAR